MDGPSGLAACDSVVSSIAMRSHTTWTWPLSSSQQESAARRAEVHAGHAARKSAHPRHHRGPRQDRGDVGASRHRPAIYLVFGDPAIADGRCLLTPHPSFIGQQSPEVLHRPAAVLAHRRFRIAELPAISASLNPSQGQAMTCRCLGGRPAIPADRNWRVWACCSRASAAQTPAARSARPGPRPAMSPGPRPGIPEILALRHLGRQAWGKRTCAPPERPG